MSRDAVHATSPENSDRAGRLHNLALNLHKRYMLLKERDDLEEGIQLLREAVHVSRPESPPRAQWFTNLGNSMADYYALTMKYEHLAESIRMLQKGLQAAPTDPARAVWLNNLGLRLADQFARTGDMAGLDEAIEIFRQSLDASSNDDSEVANRSMSLAKCLAIRSHRTGAIRDLNTAIDEFRTVVNATPPDSPERYSRVNNLGKSLSDKYLRTRDPHDLNEAIGLLREAVDPSGKRYRSRAACLGNLGDCLAFRYSLTRSSADLNEALDMSRQAVGATPTGHHGKAERLSNVALRLKDKYSLVNDLETLDEAVNVAREALDAAPVDHPVQAECMNAAGEIFRVRYPRTKSEADWKSATECFSKVLSVSNSATSVRVRAGRRFLSLPGIANYPGANTLAEAAINLIPLMTPRALQNTDKRHLLSDATGMASNAAAIALHSGQGAEAAIQYLEIGRGVIAGASFEQDDVLRLEICHPDLARTFMDLRDQLDKPSMHEAGSSIRPEAEHMDPKVVAEMELQSRHEATRRLDQLCKEIRTKRGFDRFLLPASNEEMLEAAKHGWIVILNVSSHRCDALIIEESGLRSLPLPLVSPEALEKYSMEPGSLTTLMWLWDSVVSPIFDSMDFTTTSRMPSSESTGPRVWWVPTGEMSRFPLHAAGHHLDCGRNSTLDMVISSYSPSIKAIIRGLRDQYPSTMENGKSPKDLVAVAMDETTGQSPLRYARSEVSAVLSVMGNDILPHKQPHPYRDDVLSALNNCEVFHFAGHGSTHPLEPLQSTLLLQDWKEKPLTVESLLDTKLGSIRPFLAYLSACGTSRVRNDGSMDESIHLANAFQLAGFRHVVGTLWSVFDDELCVEMAKLMYGFLRDRGLEDKSVSRGLHHATRELRDRWVKSVRINSDSMEVKKQVRDAVVIGPASEQERLFWVPYIHFGI
ncbi:hypothetical protein CEP54_009805 [Fusarium duplospermum]|uniref:CHAT domain-containing protein n=1 Tax=Fusarium duplospermum TaxID=1325734 RepID=A0A428PNK3_9HYPO|nr:hypothetical protein CEP54_009805 [Fusarium duplospermum]